jgi:hypothetical protein
MLDNKVENVVEEVKPFVSESIWIGLPNMLRSRVSTNNPALHPEANKLLNSLSKDRVKSIYNKYKTTKKIKWNNSINKMLNNNLLTNKEISL